METLLSLTSKRAGDWFKEELRLLGGLDHIVDKGKYVGYIVHHPHMGGLQVSVLVYMCKDMLSKVKCLIAMCFVCFMLSQLKSVCRT